MSDIVWGVLAILFGILVTVQGWFLLYRDPESASKEAQSSRAARFQPAWAVKQWTPANMRARAVSTFVGGPAFVVFGVLLLTGVIHVG